MNWRQIRGVKKKATAKETLSDRHAVDELADTAAERKQLGQEGGDDGQRRNQQRYHDVLRAVLGGVVEWMALIEEFHIVVGHNDGVVDQDAQHHHQHRDRNLLQVDAEQIQQREGHRNRHRNRDRSHQRHVERQQQHGDGDDGDDGDAELAHETGDAFLNHVRLVGEHVELQIGRQQTAHFAQLGGDLRAELHDVAALLHFDREHERGLPVIARQELRFLVAALDFGDVAEVQRLALRADVDHQALELAGAVQQAVGLQRQLIRGGVELAPELHAVARLQGLNHTRQRNPVLRQSLGRAGDVDLFLLFPVAFDLRGGGQRA